MPEDIKTDLAGYLLGEAPVAGETIVVVPDAPTEPVPPVVAAPVFPDARERRSTGFTSRETSLGNSLMRRTRLRKSTSWERGESLLQG